MRTRPARPRSRCSSRCAPGSRARHAGPAGNAKGPTGRLVHHQGSTVKSPTMIDEIWVSPMVHVITGVAVLVTTLLALAVTTLLAVRDKRVSTGASLMMVAAQLALMVQALIGIKLLDQGLGPLQLFIHYVG